MRGYFGAVFVLFAGFATQAVAQSMPDTGAQFRQDLEVCGANIDDPGIGAAACSRIVESGRLDGEHLGMILRRRGRFHNRLGFYKRAMMDFSQAATLNPSDAQSFYGRGLTFNLLDQPEKAVGDLSRAIRLKPDFAGAYSVRGNAHFSLDKFEHAIADYDASIRLVPDQAGVIFLRGLAHESNGRPERALADYRSAYALGSRRPFLIRKLKGLGGVTR